MHNAQCTIEVAPCFNAQCTMRRRRKLNTYFTVYFLCKYSHSPFT